VPRKARSAEELVAALSVGATARTFRRLKFTFLTPVISNWTRLQIRSRHWFEPLSLLRVGNCRRGVPADVPSRTQATYHRDVSGRGAANR